MKIDRINNVCMASGCGVYGYGFGCVVYQRGLGLKMSGVKQMGTDDEEVWGSEAKCCGKSRR